MAGKFFFSAQEDEKLVECVAAFPGLYDSEDRDYKDRVSREESWEQISNTVQRSAEECKKRWRNIKDTYFKLKRDRDKIGKNRRGARRRYQSKWPLLPQLTFLDNIAVKRRAKANEDSNVEEDNNDSNDANLSFPEDSNDYFNQDPLRTTKRKLSPVSDATAKRRKGSNTNTLDVLQSESDESEANNIENINWKNDDEDPLLLFFKSLAMTVKTFEPQIIPEVKSRIFNVVNEFEIRSIQSKFGSSAQPTITNAPRSERISNEAPINIETKYSYCSSFHHSDLT